MMLFSCFFFSSCSQQKLPPKNLVICSLIPHQFLAKQITVPEVEIEVLAKEFDNPHLYEPTPSQVKSALPAQLWFASGEGFEKKAIAAISSQNPNLQVLDLRNSVHLLPIPDDHHHGSHHHHHHDLYDTHIWLSPKRLIKQAEAIRDAMRQAYPEYSEQFKQNAKTLITHLNALDVRLKKQLAPYKGKVLLVSHPAFTYFCDDYGLEQMSLESEGKDPTPQEQTKLMEVIVKKDIKHLFTMPQYPQKGVEQFAKKMNLSYSEINPYLYDVIQNLQEISKEIQKHL